jgi:hypothetical protein
MRDGLIEHDRPNPNYRWAENGADTSAHDEPTHTDIKKSLVPS